MKGLFPGLFLLVGCTLRTALPAPTTVSTVPPVVPVTQEVILEGWQPIAPGLEIRTYVPHDNTLVQIRALRIDPDYYRFRAHYHPGEPLTVHQWRDALPGSSAFVNGNLFSRDYTVVGMVVADSIVFGESLRGYGGVFQVQEGIPRVRSLVVEPYYGEPLEQMVQAFPMLVAGGQPAYNSSRSDRATRRTVVGQDTSGRIILMATPLLGLALRDLSAYLPTTDMELINAVNLDGGGSTMLYVVGETLYSLPSFDPVPSVLAIYPK